MVNKPVAPALCSPINGSLYIAPKDDLTKQVPLYLACTVEVRSKDVPFSRELVVVSNEEEKDSSTGFLVFGVQSGASFAIDGQTFSWWNPGGTLRYALDIKDAEEARMLRDTVVKGLWESLWEKESDGVEASELNKVLNFAQEKSFTDLLKAKRRTFLQETAGLYTYQTTKEYFLKVKSGVVVTITSTSVRISYAYSLMVFAVKLLARR